MSGIRKWFGRRLGIAGLVALFFLACLPLLPNVSRWRGDERFYTDAVIGMTQSGNYLAPTYSDGSLRFKKPILSYWVVLLSYGALGINYMASRLPFLVAGTLVVWLTYHLGLILVRRRPEALVAAAVMASNLTVLHTSVRSTPDMLLTLWITISMVGFARLIFHGSRALLDFCLAYMGVALAVATKGLFGVLPLLFAFGYVWRVKPAGMRVRDLIHGPALLAAIPVAVAWFVWAFFQHGETAAADFWGDQVGERLSGSKWYILSNAGVYLSSFVLQMLPWSGFACVPLYILWRRRLVVFLCHRRELGFMAAWILLLFVVFVFGNIQRTRYFLPAYPHLSIFYAVLLCAGFRNTWARPVLVALFRVLCACVLAWGITLVIGGVRIHAGLVVAGVFFAGLSIFLMRRLNRWAGWVVMTGVGAFLVAGFAITDMVVRPVFFVSPAPAITREVLSLNPAGGAVAMADVSLNYVSQVRVLSGGRVCPVDLGESAAPDEIARYPLLVCPGSGFERGQYGMGTVVGRIYGISGWRPGDYLALMSSRRRDAVWASRREEYYLVRP